MNNKPYIKIPTWNNGNWDYTLFGTKEEFRDYVLKLFKEPGQYQFNDTAFLFNEHARHFEAKKLYSEAPEGSRDFLDYWDTEKEKCRKGVLYINNSKAWYLPRWYYHWLNFLRIYDKRPEFKRFMFADVMDVQYHVALYDILAMLHGKHSGKLKKRQIAMSYYHMALIYNRYIFEEGFVGKIMASDKKYIDNTNGCWKFLEEYHNFTNTHTAWIRTNSPEKVFSWQQKLETKTHDGRKVDIGTRATITGVSLDKDPVSGVGGATDIAYYEEGGIAPTADKTMEYMKPAMTFAGENTGTFMISGSVGDLSQCKPLKDMIENPLGNDIYSVESDLLDEHGTKGVTGLFIPEQWGYLMDQYGNSLVKESLAAIDAEFEEAKKNKDPEKYQLMVSQHPRNIAEAFAVRTVSVFPVKHTAKQEQRIKDNIYAIEHVELERTEKNEIVVRKSDRLPIDEFPVKKAMADKRGVICIHERPVRGLEGRVDWDMYYGSIDPIEVGSTKNSDSLASIYIYRRSIQVTRIDAEGESETYMDGDKLVAWWCGRYDDPNETNEQMRKLVEYYNAWTICENNKTSFINYMIAKKCDHYLATTKDMLFDKTLEVTQSSQQKYGWSKSGTKLWEKVLEYGVNFLSEELDPQTDENGFIKRIKYGVERIPDIMLLKEMQQYADKGNFDRIISFCALIAFVKIQDANRGIKSREERDTKLENTQKLSTLPMRQPFSHIGRGNKMMGEKVMRKRSFRNIR